MNLMVLLGTLTDDRGGNRGFVDENPEKRGASKLPNHFRIRATRRGHRRMGYQTPAKVEVESRRFWRKSGTGWLVTCLIA